MRLAAAVLAVLIISLLTWSTASAAEPLGDRTFQQAYNDAPAGQTTVIEVPPGTYPSPSLTGTKPAGTRVVFKATGTPAANIGQPGTPSAGNGADHVEFDGFRVGGFHVRTGADDWTFRNIYSTSRVFVSSASNVRVIDSVIDGAGQYWTNGSQVKAATGGPPPVNVLFDGVTFRNFEKDPATSNHVDCLHYFTGTGLTIRRSTFDNCEHFAILYTVSDGPTPSGIVVEDSRFGAIGDGFYAVQLGGGHGEAFSDVTMRYNASTEEELTAGTDNTLSGVVFEGNRATVLGCSRPGVTCLNNGPLAPGPRDVTPDPTPTPTPTPEPTPVPTPTPTPEPYAPACEPDCDQTISDLRTENADLQAQVADLQGQLDAARAVIAAVRAALDG